MACAPRAHKSRLRPHAWPAAARGSCWHAWDAARECAPRNSDRPGTWYLLVCKTKGAHFVFFPRNQTKSEPGILLEKVVFLRRCLAFFSVSLLSPLLPPLLHFKNVQTYKKIGNKDEPLPESPNADHLHIRGMCLPHTCILSRTHPDRLPLNPPVTPPKKRSPSCMPSVSSSHPGTFAST